MSDLVAGPRVCHFCGISLEIQASVRAFLARFRSCCGDQPPEATSDEQLETLKSFLEDMVEVPSYRTVGGKRRKVVQWAHENCANWSVGVFMKGGRRQGIPVALATAAATKCGHCSRIGSSLRCDVGTLKKGKGIVCMTTFHFPCAVLLFEEERVHMDSDDCMLFCPQHQRLALGTDEAPSRGQAAKVSTKKEIAPPKPTGRDSASKKAAQGHQKTGEQSASSKKAAAKEKKEKQSADGGSDAKSELSTAPTGTTCTVTVTPGTPLPTSPPPATEDTPGSTTSSAPSREDGGAGDATVRKLAPSLDYATVVKPTPVPSNLLEEVSKVLKHKTFMPTAELLDVLVENGQTVSIEALTAFVEKLHLDNLLFYDADDRTIYPL